MRLSVAIVLAVLVGGAVGAGTGAWRVWQAPWNGYPEEPSPSPLTPKPPAAGEPAAKVAVDQEEYDFGKMAFGSEMSHDFKFTNAGRAPLVLTAGPTTCRCTVSEVSDNKLLPGESFKVTVHWRGREVTSDYRQTRADQHQRPGPAGGQAFGGRRGGGLLAADPSELVFSDLSQDEPASGEVRLLCSRAAAAGNPRLQVFRPGLGQVFRGLAAAAGGGGIAGPKGCPERRLVENHRQTGVASRGISTDNPS